MSTEINEIITRFQLFIKRPIKLINMYVYLIDAK